MIRATTSSVNVNARESRWGIRILVDRSLSAPKVKQRSGVGDAGLVGSAVTGTSPAVSGDTCVPNV
jgi:hypothetical protein